MIMTFGKKKFEVLRSLLSYSGAFFFVGVLVLVIVLLCFVLRLMRKYLRLLENKFISQLKVGFNTAFCEIPYV